MFYNSITTRRHPNRASAFTTTGTSTSTATDIDSDSARISLDAIDAEMTQFALRFSRYEDARVLYQSLVTKS